MRTWWFWFSVFYALFIVYGSFVPLNLQPVALGRALDLFLRGNAVRGSSISAPDIAANVLLGLPLAFLWLGVCWRRYSHRPVILALTVWSASVSLSLAVELTQVVFPPRNSSFLDVVAQAFGAFLGVLLWFWRGVTFYQALQEWRDVRGAEVVSIYLLSGYLAGLFFYAVMPLDLVLDPTDLSQAADRDQIVWIPAALHGEISLEVTFRLFTDVLMWLPVGYLWVLSGRKSTLGAVLWVAVVAGILEIAQILLRSRVTDSGDVLTAIAGATLGGVMSRWLAMGDRTRPSARLRLILSLAAIPVWMCLLLAWRWYPFEFHSEYSFLQSRWVDFWSWPFVGHHRASQFDAISIFLNQFLLYAALGMLCALARHLLAQTRMGRIADWAFPALLILYPLLLELGEIARPLSYPDSTDWLIGLAGGLSAYSLTRDVCRKLGSELG